MSRAISGMNAIITGASAGIGRALALCMSRQGANLVLAARRLDRLEALNQELGGRHLCVQADVSDERACVDLVDQARKKFGRIDVLVCNAGYGVNRDVADTSAEEFRKIIAANLFGTTDCIRAAVPLMRAQDIRDRWRGQVMIVSSCLARRGIIRLGAYCATKAAQLSIAEAMRVELADARIAVTTVHPIGTETEFSQASAKRSGQPSTPSSLKTMQTAEHVADAMIRAMRRPRPEVWPHGMSRLLFSCVTLFPRFGDWLVCRFRR
jgi:short-subunit dehydrogenase